MSEQGAKGVPESAPEATKAGIGDLFGLLVASLAFVLLMGLVSLPQLFAATVYSNGSLRPPAAGSLSLNAIFVLVVYVIAPVVVLFLLVMKRRPFPVVYCVWAFAIPVSVVATAWDGLTRPDSAVITMISVGGFLGPSLIWAIVWTIYLLRSKRVKNTFVN